MAWEGAEVVEKGLERGTPDLFRGASGVSTDTGQTPHTAPMFRMSSRLVTVVAKHARDRPRRVDVGHLPNRCLRRRKAIRRSKLISTNILKRWG